MNIFSYYLGLGIEHITDINGYDHILFLAALISIYTLSKWKEILILITSFTIGHSVTLVLATLDLLIIPSVWIEFLIPVTILITAASNLINTNVKSSVYKFKYLLALFFGMIHGLGFSNFLRSILAQEDSLIMPLFGFNIGIEFGQIIIVLIILTISHLIINRTRLIQRDWNLVVSGMIIGMSLLLIFERIPGQDSETLPIEDTQEEIELFDQQYDIHFYTIEDGKYNMIQVDTSKLAIVFSDSLSEEYISDVISQFYSVSNSSIGKNTAICEVNGLSYKDYIVLLEDIQLEDNVVYASPICNHNEQMVYFSYKYLIEIPDTTNRNIYLDNLEESGFNIIKTDSAIYFEANDPVKLYRNLELILDVTEFVPLFIPVD